MAHTGTMLWEGNIKTKQEISNLLRSARIKLLSIHPIARGEKQFNSSVTEINKSLIGAEELINNSVKLKSVLLKIIKNIDNLIKKNSKDNKDLGTKNQAGIQSYLKQAKDQIALAYQKA